METCVVSNHFFTMHSLNPFSGRALSSDEMAIRVKLPDSEYIENTTPIKMQLKEVDEVDNPRLNRSESEDNDKMDKLYESMKHELNRLNSFSGKWPLGYVKPADLAATGFFYLQSDDRVQCTFCRVIIDDWTVGQKPMREHMRKSPKCPFLVSDDVGNIPIVHQRPKNTLITSLPVMPGTPYTPKHPRMSALKNRLSTYRDWPRIMLSPKQLADCGLYYTGVADVVTCFFCGGSLGNWELDDDPWVEHEKFFPNCTYLRLLKSNGKFPTKPTSLAVTSRPVETSASNSLNALHREVIRQACEIFPKSLVEKAVLKRMSDGSQRFTSLNELCEDILELKEQERKPWAQPVKVEPERTDPVKTEAVVVQNLTETVNRPVKDVLLCKICMDREMGVVFQPCGHLVSCPKCAEKIFDCPLCRRPVTNKVRTYLS